MLKIFSMLILLIICNSHQYFYKYVYFNTDNRPRSTVDYNQKYEMLPYSIFLCNDSVYIKIRIIIIFSVLEAEFNQ